MKILKVTLEWIAVIAVLILCSSIVGMFMAFSYTNRAVIWISRKFLGVKVES